MKTKILYACLGVLLISIILLIVYIVDFKIYINDYINDNMKLWGGEYYDFNAVPDEETALKIADIVINARPEFDKERKRGVEINYNEESEEWEIYYYTIPPEGYLVAGGGLEINIRRDNGMITKIFYGI